jgi:hypothetical protein
MFISYFGCYICSRLTAILLGRLRMSTKEALKVYPEFAKAVFGKPKPSLHLLVKGGKSTHYSATIMEEEMKKIVRNKLQGDGSEHEMMMDSRDDLCKT